MLDHAGLEACTPRPGGPRPSSSWARTRTRNWLVDVHDDAGDRQAARPSFLDVLAVPTPCGGRRARSAERRARPDRPAGAVRVRAGRGEAHQGVVQEPGDPADLPAQRSSKRVDGGGAGLEDGVAEAADQRHRRDPACLELGVERRVSSAWTRSSCRRSIAPRIVAAPRPGGHRSTSHARAALRPQRTPDRRTRIDIDRTSRPVCAVAATASTHPHRGDRRLRPRERIRSCARRGGPWRRKKRRGTEHRHGAGRELRARPRRLLASSGPASVRSTTMRTRAPVGRAGKRLAAARARRPGSRWHRARPRGGGGGALGVSAERRRGRARRPRRPRPASCAMSAKVLPRRGSREA